MRDFLFISPLAGTFISKENGQRSKIALTVGERIDKVEQDPYFVGVEEY